MRREWRALAALLAIVLWAGPAAAQETGGSMGGGDWGGGGGSWDTGSSSSSWDGSTGSLDSSSSSSGGGGSPLAGVLVFAGLMGAFFGTMWLLDRERKRRRGGQPKARGPRRVDVSVLRLAVDARARRYLQAEMNRIASGAGTGSIAGLVRMLREVTAALRRCRDSWVYAGVVNARPMAPDEARAFFQSQADQSRAGFKHELVRAAAGTLSAAGAPEQLRARHEEGPGLVVVTVVVAARGTLVDFHDRFDAEEIRRWLEAIGQLHGGNLVAVEVIWTPADEEDRMSSVELETLYPEMKKLRDATSPAGRVFCDHCGGVFPAELQSCPHCGAKVPQVA